MNLSKINAKMPQYWKILTVIIVFISITLYNVEYLTLRMESVTNFLIQTNDPIFDNLAHSTKNLIDDLVKFNIPANIDIKKLRKTSTFLSNIISLSLNSTNLLPIYLQFLGDKAYTVGTQVESVYVSGSLTLAELSNELQEIEQNLSQNFLSQNFLLTQEDVQYFSTRLNQILNLMIGFDDKIVNIQKTIRGIQKLCNVKRFSKIIEHFDDKESAYKQIFDMDIVQSKLDFEQRQIDELMNIEYKVATVKKSLNSYNKELVNFIERIKNLGNRKIVTHWDCQVLKKVIESVNMAKGIWNKMGESGNSRMLLLEA